MELNNLTPKISSYLKMEIDEGQKKPAYKADYVGMFEYENGTRSVILPPGKSKCEVGEDFRDFKGKLNVITEIIETRPHKGTFINEANRNTMVLVRSEIVPGI